MERRRGDQNELAGRGSNEKEETAKKRNEESAHKVNKKGEAAWVGFPGGAAWRKKQCGLMRSNKAVDLRETTATSAKCRAQEEEKKGAEGI